MRSSSIARKSKRSREAGTWIKAPGICRIVYSSLLEFGRRAQRRSLGWRRIWSADSTAWIWAACSAAKSMLHLRSNASKFALLLLIEHLKTRDAAWIDIQVITPHFEILGAKEIERNEFLSKLENTQRKRPAHRKTHNRNSERFTDQFQFSPARN